MKSQQYKVQTKVNSNRTELDKKKIIIGSIIATFIASTPYLFSLHESVPDAKIWDTFLGCYESKYFESANIFVWVLASRLIPFSLLVVWFFTCRHWWFHTILVPIVMYIHQIIVTLDDDLYFLDNNHNIYLITTTAIIIPSIYLIRARIFKKINETTKSMQELEEEFKLSPKNIWERIKLYF